MHEGEHEGSPTTDGVQSHGEPICCFGIMRISCSQQIYYGMVLMSMKGDNWRSGDVRRLERSSVRDDDSAKAEADASPPSHQRKNHHSNAPRMRPSAMLLSLFGVAFAGLAAAACYEPSFAHPPPKYDRDHPILKDALTHLHDVLTVALGDPKFNSTSISVEVTSSQESLWEFHHTARERNASRPDIPHVNGSALYRIASITKTFTVLGLLQQHAAGNLSLDDPVDRYLTELKGPQNGT
jgi:hypothetical protein